MSLVCDSRRALTFSAGCSTCTPAFWGDVMRRAWTGLLRRPFQSRTWSRSGEVRRGSAPGHICGCQPGMLCPGLGHRDGTAVHQSQPQLTLPSSGLGPGQPRVLFVHSHKMPGMTRTVGFKMQLLNADASLLRNTSQRPILDGESTLGMKEKAVHLFLLLIYHFSTYQALV